MDHGLELGGRGLRAIVFTRLFLCHRLVGHGAPQAVNTVARRDGRRDPRARRLADIHSAVHIRGRLTEELKPAVEKRQETLAKDVGKMLGEEGTADYMVECGGHRAVLATRSSTIAKGLRSGLVEGILQRWVVKGADPDDVKEMLAFIYTINFVKMHCREVMKSPDWPQS